MTTPDAPSAPTVPSWRYIAASIGEIGYWCATLRAFGHEVLELTADDSGYWTLSNAISGRIVAKYQEHATRCKPAADVAKLKVQGAAARAIKELEWALADLTKGERLKAPR